MTSKNICKTLAKQEPEGFSLVELSVVIVVIGIIISGVTAGRSLIASAKVRAQASDLQMYSAAFNGFIFQYNALPGDMRNATTYWPTATNGNGNGKNDVGADQGSPSDISGERYTIFQHLALAHLIPGNYNNTYVLGTGYPALKVNNGKGMMSAGFVEDQSDGGFSYQLSIAQVTLAVKSALFLNIGDPNNNGNGFDDVSNCTMSAVQAYAIDIKIDDGKARTGSFKAYSSWNGWTEGTEYYCLESNDGDYATSNSKGRCMGEYILKK